MSFFGKVRFDKILAKYAKAYSVRKYVQFHGLGSQLAVIREEWGILKRELVEPVLEPQ